MIHDTETFVQVWDTVGQERFSASSVGGAFFRGAHGALLVYDVNNDKSIEQVEQWRDECVSRQGSSDFFPVVVIGNKTDIRDNNPEDKRIDQSGILTWCRDNSYGHIETSAKDGVGVEAAMIAVAALALEAQRNNARNNSNSTTNNNNKQRTLSTNGSSNGSGKIDLSSRYEKQSSGCSGGSCT